MQLRWFAGAALAALLSLHVLRPSAAHDTANLPALVARLEPTAVALIAYQPKRRSAAERYDIMGGGCFVTAAGHIITADHVLRRIIQPEGHVRRSADLSRLAIGWLPEPDRTEATILTNASRMAVRVLKRDAGLDLALLQADVDMAQAVMLASSDAPVGTDVAVLGFPFGSVLGFRPLVSRGTLAGRRKLPGRTEDAPRFTGYILDGSVHPGHSGSPVFDTATGHMVGLVQRRVTQTVPVAISSGEILAFLRTAGISPTPTDSPSSAPTTP